jgi:hypothetical protein
VGCANKQTLHNRKTNRETMRVIIHLVGKRFSATYENLLNNKWDRFCDMFALKYIKPFLILTKVELHSSAIFEQIMNYTFEH